MKAKAIRARAMMGTIFLCAGCGGSAGVSDNSGTLAAAFADLASTQTDQLRSISFDATARTIQTLDGEIDRSADTASVAGQTGSINEERTEIAITSGGVVTLLPEDDRFAVRFTADPATGNRLIGIAGAVAPVSALPSGTVTYNGDARLSVQSGTDLYTLAGDVTVTGDFGGGSVDTTIENLFGTVTNGISNSVAVTDVADIQITGSVLNGSSFSGGAPTVTSSEFSVGPTASVAFEGAIFGPSATEAGGAMIIDDTADGAVVIFGDFLAEQ
ncbi:transferrin-binding protein-like solute binding protein [Yoonia sp. SS1-5]|uniref:Transferrin-binding protein-like solute binding protein n=1 Tax=Yoonia rhodophyticola TaxID=3137370 RepID=A0AAN0M7R1_9RHOB